MTKGKLLKFEGIISNIPVTEVDVNCKMLPGPVDSNGFLIVKLKRKLEYKCDGIFEVVRPTLVVQLLQFLKSQSFIFSY